MSRQNKIEFLGILIFFCLHSFSGRALFAQKNVCLPALVLFSDFQPESEKQVVRLYQQIYCIVNFFLYQNDSALPLVEKQAQANAFLQKYHKEIKFCACLKRLNLKKKKGRKGLGFDFFCFSGVFLLQHLCSNFLSEITVKKQREQSEALAEEDLCFRQEQAENVSERVLCLQNELSALTSQVQDLLSKVEGMGNSVELFSLGQQSLDYAQMIVQLRQALLEVKEQLCQHGQSFDSFEQRLAQQQLELVNHKNFSSEQLQAILSVYKEMQTFLEEHNFEVSQLSSFSDVQAFPWSENASGSQVLASRRGQNKGQSRFSPR